MKVTLSVPQKSLRWIKFLRLISVAVLFLLAFSYISISISWANSFTSAPNRTLGPLIPTQYGLSYENVSFQSAAEDKINLRGWWLPNPKASRALIMVHGKGGTRTMLLGLSKPLWDSGYSLLFFDLRGHGESDGEHYSFGQREQFDVIGAVNFVKSKGFGPGAIGAVGWSMGGASAIMAMSQTADLKAVVSDSSYANYAQLTQTRYASGPSMTGLLLPGMLAADRLLLDVDIDQVKPEDAIRKLGQRHVFLIHGDQDFYVPVSEYERLRQVGGANVTESWLVPGADHILSFERYPAEYARRVIAFFDRELVF